MEFFNDVKKINNSIQKNLLVLLRLFFFSVCVMSKHVEYTDTVTVAICSIESSGNEQKVEYSLTILLSNLTIKFIFTQFARPPKRVTLLLRVYTILTIKGGGTKTVRDTKTMAISQH